MASLFKKGSVFQGELDDAEGELLTLQGQIEGYEATINRRQTTAPFDGITGLLNIYMGEYLSTGTEIVRLEDISRMRIRFTVAQNDFSKIYIGQTMNIIVDADADTIFTGKISAIESAVNFQSGLIQVEADIPNIEQRSRMFAKADIIMPTLQDQMIIPDTAINYTLYGEMVYVLSE